MKEYNLVIIGAGASGLLAGIAALEENIENVLIIEQEEDLGGNLNLFINNDFGEFHLGEKVPGPEFASILITTYISLNGQFKNNTRVLEITDNKKIKYVNPYEGEAEIIANKIILASGCREKYTGNIIVPIHKYTGIFSTAAAHRLVNFQGLLPGREVILSGNTMWTYILARRLVIEGAKVKGIITSRESVNEDLANIIDEFDVPVICNSEVVEVGGSERIEWARIENYSGKEESKIIECDSLVLAIGYYPEIDYLKNSNIKINEDSLEIDYYKTSIDDIYCCGTIINGRNGLFNSGEDGYKVGKIVASQMK